MTEFTQQQMDVTASLWGKPGTSKEIAERDFLENLSAYGIRKILRVLEDKGWVYKRGRKYYTYVSTVTEVLNPNDYELETDTDK